MRGASDAAAASPASGRKTGAGAGAIRILRGGETRFRGAGPNLVRTSGERMPRQRRDEVGCQKGRRDVDAILHGMAVLVEEVQQTPDRSRSAFFRSIRAPPTGGPYLRGRGIRNDLRYNLALAATFLTRVQGPQPASGRRFSLARNRHVTG